MKKTIILDQGEKLFINVYHIGYSEQGESSIFILYTEKEKVLFSMVVDCYEENACNITEKILDYWNLKEKLNVLVWTHPHDDHSAGIEKIIHNYCNKESCLYLANVFALKDKCSPRCKEILDYIERINYKKHRLNRWKISSMGHYPEVMEMINFAGNSKIKKLIVQCIAPSPEIGSLETAKTTPDLNALSLGCIVKIEMLYHNINFMFAGDMDNSSFDRLIDEDDMEIPTIYNYIKIPHHGSRTASSLSEFLQIEGGVKSEIASTSVYKANGLPNVDMIEEYKAKIAKIVGTSDISNQEYGMGVLKLRYKLDEASVRCELFGTAKYM